MYLQNNNNNNDNNNNTFCSSLLGIENRNPPISLYFKFVEFLFLFLVKFCQGLEHQTWLSHLGLDRQCT
jgi:hypothetical protein